MSKSFLALILSTIFILIENKASSQKYHEGGFFSGISAYNGEINTTKLFYAPSISVGALYKRQLNLREGIRLNANYAQFRGADKDFANIYQKNRNASFSASLIDINLCYEVSFLPFKYHPRLSSITPFLFGGLGWEYMLKGSSSSHFAIPFGMGIKYALSPKINIGTEISFRKTFADDIDGVENPGTTFEKSAISNTDWYSFSGFFITFRLFDHSGECPAYQ
jgi:hypothetical protein